MGIRPLCSCLCGRYPCIHESTGTVGQGVPIAWNIRYDEIIWTNRSFNGTERRYTWNIQEMIVSHSLQVVLVA